MALGGAQEYFGVVPDMATVSKAIANGYPVSAVVGRREIMQVAETTRLSSTFLVNTFPMAAAIETIAVLQEEKGVAAMWSMGKRLMDGLKKIIDEMVVDAQVIGAPPLPYLFFDNEMLKKQFYIETTKRGVLLHPNHCWFLSLGHTEKDLEKTLDVSRESLKAAKKAL
jgi:glutamate-1-semialdehyde aminotransferase